MIGLHITDVKKSIIIALFVATTMMITSGAHSDTPVCPCNDNGQYDYLASDASASICATAPVPKNDPGTKGGGISALIRSSFGQATVTIDNESPTRELRVSCTNNITGQPPIGFLNLTPAEGHICMVEMLQSCRDAGF